MSIDPKLVNDPKNRESIRRELASGPQDEDLPWPPPPHWDFHKMRLTIEKEIRLVKARLEQGDMIQQLTAQADLKRAERRWRRWKLIAFFSGWKPGQDREPPGE